MDKELFGQILGIVILICFVISAQFPKRWQILMGHGLINLLSSVNQLILGAGLTACFICMLATLHCPINAYKSKKGIPHTLLENLIWSILYLAASFGGLAKQKRLSIVFASGEPKARAGRGECIEPKLCDTRRRVGRSFSGNSNGGKGKKKTETIASVLFLGS